VSRDVAADCLRQADGPPTQGERRAPARLTFSAGAAWFPLVQTATRRRSSRGVDSVCGLGGWEAPERSTRRPAQDLRGWLEFAWSRAREPLSFDDVIEGSVTGLDGQYPKGHGVLLEGVADRELRVPLGRKPFACGMPKLGSHS
jgi:hypothetical protein